MPQRKVVETFYAKIYMAGDIQVATSTCRKYCDEVGLCVRLYESFYIYTGGSESGFCVQLINYPRFPSESYDIFLLAKELADRLMLECKQVSYTIETPKKTYWHSERENDT